VGRDAVKGTSLNFYRRWATLSIVELDSYGFPKTSGIFETIKTIDGAPIALARHMRRALESALDLGIPMPSEEYIRNEIIKIVAEYPQKIGRLRICFAPNLFHITHDEYVEIIDPARLDFHSSTVIGSIHKSFPYDFRFALLKGAQNEGFHDRILFNDKNEITETAVANLVFLIAGEWVTPPITAGILPGIMRAISIEECGVKVRPIHISEIPDIESGLMLSSLRIAQPISHIGDMTLRIAEASSVLIEKIRSHAQPVSVG
jgi:branched-chain amino acid aminotransferase